MKSIDHILIGKSLEGPVKSVSMLEEIQVFLPGRRDLIEEIRRRKTRAIIRDSGTGALYLDREILLRLKPGVTLSEFKKILSDIKGTVIDSNETMGSYKIRVPEKYRPKGADRESER